MIEITGLRKRFDGASGISYTDLRFETGRSYVLLGASGCGKSTLLNLIAGIIAPSEGQIVIDGEEKTASLQAWSKWANDEQVEGLTDVYGAFRDYSYETRCQIMAGMEECFMNWYACTPVYYRNVASLDSQKIQYAVPEYLNELVVRGGIAFMTYNYDDAAWDEYVAANPLVY